MVTSSQRFHHHPASAVGACQRPATPRRAGASRDDLDGEADAGASGPMLARAPVVGRRPRPERPRERTVRRGSAPESGAVLGEALRSQPVVLHGPASSRSRRPRLEPDAHAPGIVVARPPTLLSAGRPRQHRRGPHGAPCRRRRRPRKPLRPLGTVVTGSCRTTGGPLEVVIASHTAATGARRAAQRDAACSASSPVSARRNASGHVHRVLLPLPTQPVPSASSPRTENAELLVGPGPDLRHPAPPRASRSRRAPLGGAARGAGVAETRR